STVRRSTQLGIINRPGFATELAAREAELVHNYTELGVELRYRCFAHVVFSAECIYCRKSVINAAHINIEQW
ncbi:TPA: hypothetical protein ACSPZW_002745, partial [Aeromonas hydrophila]